MYYANVAGKSFSDNFPVGQNTSRQKYILGTFQRVSYLCRKGGTAEASNGKGRESTTAVADLE